MLLFVISFLLVFISSYFLVSIISPKKSILGLIYLFLIAFAQIVVTFEILSLFTAIKEIWVLSGNVLFFVISAYLWNKRSIPCWSLDYADFRNRVINSFKLDKSLMWLYVGFCAFLIVALILCLLLPITNADAQAYHVARSVFWVLQGSLNHFDVSDVRNLCLPINSEILYGWVFLFLKKDMFLGLFSFVGYLISIISIYNILSLLGYSVRKKLWTIFMVSSYASVIVQVSGTETDIIIAGLVLSSIFLFWYSLKNNEKTPLFMASLAYALAIGTKTTSLIALPGVGLFLLALCFYFKKYKPLGWFLGFGVVNFLIFSAYNYILNYIEFGNFMGSISVMTVTKNYYGIKGLISNFIKYMFLFFDFTGFRWSDYVGPQLISLRDSILNFLHLGVIKDGLYTTPYVVNRLLLEPVMGAGVLGFLVYLPCLIRSGLNPIFHRKSKKVWFLFAFAIVFILNMLILSYLLAYMSFSVRFVMSFMVISSPILIFSYLSRKNPLKYVIVGFSLFYLLGVSTHLWPRPFVKIARILIEHPSINDLRERTQCKTYEENPKYANATCPLRHRIQKSFPKDTNILAFLNTSDSIYLIKSLEFEGFKIDFRTMEDINNIDFSKYNVVISTNRGQTSTVVKDYEQRKYDYKVVNNKIVMIKNKSVPCIYIPNPNISDAVNKEALYPFQVRCGMSGEFLKGKNLQLIGITGLVESTSENYDYYTIYVNTKLPLKFKK